MILRLLTETDLPDALRLSSTAGWNQQLEDWRMLLSLAPAGCFAALEGGSIVGTSMGIPYGEFSWIAMMLVDPAYRGQGLGRRLLEAAVDAVPADRPVRLDATPLGRPLYESFGFVEETTLTRFTASGEPDGVLGNPRKAAPPLTAIETVTALDRRVFGADRLAVLRWALERWPQYARVLADGPSHGYCFGRQGRLFDQIGPVVADGEIYARVLVAAALAASEGRHVAVDAFDDCEDFTGWLRGWGFVAQRPLFRMCRPARGGIVYAGRDHRDGVPREYAIFGPEFA
jgi:GNAT superfamily N-acetyltransferase